MATAQGQLDLRSFTGTEHLLPPTGNRCALEDDDFPFDVISDVAEAESWRKELNRPTYHVHKWWALRLGSVFRAITLGALAPAGTDILAAFYRPVRLTGRVVFDPFMGSGTTVGEALKLGARAIGRDINPVAHFLVRNALAPHDPAAVRETFRQIERDVAAQIRSFYRTELDDGTPADVLYYFWVKQVECPACRAAVDLFSSRVFARHAVPRRKPEAHCVCPACGEINVCRFDASEATCRRCSVRFDPQTGPANGQVATCPECENSFPIAKTVRAKGSPPAHRLYAKLVLKPNGDKMYARATAADRNLYDEASKALSRRPDAYPRVPIQPGYNTNQALGYNYRYWHQMFNDRQLLCLSLLADRVRQVPEPPLRDLFTCLFSGVLEFNNMFASYKGEGTGAVRHMFAHHILKPERAPLEANIWGTPKSSGSFSTMFEGRIIRALEYARDPFELRPRPGPRRQRADRVYGLSEPLGYDVATDRHRFDEGRKVYLSCGDSSRTDLRPGSVDAVVTDPPFFDNVHYSQLADFFHVWQRHILEGGAVGGTTTRSEAEVQHAEVAVFTNRLTRVWVEAYRVLADDGVLSFTYHHSRSEGWRSVLEALMEAGFCITAAHPLKAEMSVAMPKRQAKEPIDLDVVLVCRKRTRLPYQVQEGVRSTAVRSEAMAKAERLAKRGRRLSRNDVRVIVMAVLLLELSRLRNASEALAALDAITVEVETMIADLHRAIGDLAAEHRR